MDFLKIIIKNKKNITEKPHGFEKNCNTMNYSTISTWNNVEYSCFMCLS